MGNYNCVPISGEKLIREIKKMGVPKYMISSAIGFSKPYLANCCYQGKISKSALILLEQMYGISYDSIKPDTVQVEQDSHLAKLTEKKVQQEKIEFFESCEKRISNAVETLNVCLNMISQMTSIRDQVECDMQDLIWLQDIYHNTLKRIKERS